MSVLQLWMIAPGTTDRLSITQTISQAILFSQKMPTLEVKPNVALAYLDSGRPDPSNEDYMTIFALHGYTFYTPFFKPTIAVSNKYNIRLVAITRRDYPGSSLLTDEDIKAAVEGPTEKRLQALKERGEEVLLFIDQFINIHKIPSINSSGGGFSLLAWSLGNVHGLSALAFANDFPDLVERLTPEGLASGDTKLLNQKTPDASRPSVFSQLTTEERATMLDFKPPLRADLFYYKLDQAVNEAILKRVFIQQDSQSLIAWPNIPVKSLFGDQSVWLIPFGQRELEKWVKIQQSNAKENGRWVRTLESTCTSSTSHFSHYEEPDSFVQAVKRLMR